MNIVAITENDWEDLKEIRLTSLKESPGAFGISYHEARNYTPEDWKLRASENEGPRFILAYEGDAPIGLIGGIFANDEYELISMWVSPKFRGSSVGIQLVDALKEYAAKQGHNEIMLKVSPTNKSACHLYIKCGFSVVSEAGALASNDNINLQKMVWAASIKP
jgi:ribosomal protein S18 acetylase RimI-like enzyme